MTAQPHDHTPADGGDEVADAQTERAADNPLLRAMARQRGVTPANSRAGEPDHELTFDDGHRASARGLRRRGVGPDAHTQH